MQSMIQAELDTHIQAVTRTAALLADPIEAACRLATQTLARRRKILLFGNGGSAADAQHIAAEFTGRFRLERQGLPAIALTTDTSALTAIGNDYGFDQIFARQVEALAQSDDLLIGYSTSGASANVVAALQRGRELGCKTLGLTGGQGGAMKALCDVCLCVPSDNTARVQEIHLLIGHTICQVAEQALCGAVDESPAVQMFPRQAA
jgi:D-sedoheptulose 7-phosphate isomerase